MDWLRCALPQPNHTHAQALEKPFLQTQIELGLLQALENPTHAGPTLSTWFRKNRKIGSRDRKIVAPAIYGIIRNEHFLQKAGFTTPQQQIKGWQSLLHGETFSTVRNHNPIDDFATALSLPKQITQQWQQKLSPQQCQKLAQIINIRAPQYLRANPQKTTRKQLQQTLQDINIATEICPQTNHGLKLLHPANIIGNKSYQNGEFEIQDLSSQRFIETLEITSNMTVLDLCAGAGGKSLAMAALGAKVYAWDIRSNALTQLKKRTQRAGVNIQIGLPTNADIVIVDAPCSGTGRLRREPTLRWRYKHTNLIQECITIQQEILNKAQQYLHPTGEMIYSTCSILEEENNHIPAGWTTIDSNWIWPQEDQGDGFFWRIMKK